MTVATGNKLLDKIDWEEYSLKTVQDPKSITTEKVRLLLGLDGIDRVLGSRCASYMG